ncbi:MAG: DUF4476 domain-containing protein [Bacteroidota bacterium]
MKKLILSALIIVFSVSTFAQIKGSLTIYAKEGEKIWLVKNGVKQNTEPSTSVTIKDISDKYFKIKVIIDNEKMTSVDKQIQMVDVDNKMCDITYELRAKKGAYSLSMISWTPIDAQTVSNTSTTTSTTTPKTQTTTVGTTDFQQNTNMNQTGVTQTTNTGQTQTNVNMGENGANVTIKDPELGVNINMNMGMPNTQGTVTSSTTTTTTTTSSSTVNGKQTHGDNQVRPKPQPRPEPKPNHQEHHDNDQSATSNSGCYSAMNASEFTEAKAQVQNASFADDKIRIAKQITEANCLSIVQIKEIAKLFSFEDNKLEYLKFAYDFTFEKKKYYMVNDLLNFSSSKEELDNYLKSKK